MAAVAQYEDPQLEDRRLAEEIERARLEEEARILAFQQQQAAIAQTQPPPVTFTNPQGPIGVGIPAGVTLPEMPRQMVGDAQYQLEVERAQRGSGFINADVSPTGEVITGAYDPATDPRAIAAEQAATSYKRQQLYGSLLRDGATAAEAFRFANSRYPDIKSAAGLMRAEALAERNKPFVPRIVNVGGLPMIQQGRASYKMLQQPKTQGGKPSRATEIASDNLADQITSLRRRLEPGPSGVSFVKPEEAARIRADITRKEQERVALFETPEANPNVDQTSFEQMRPAWEAAGRAPMVMPQSATLASATPVSETITVTTKEDFAKLPNGAIYVGKDGKRYRKP